MHDSWINYEEFPTYEGVYYDVNKNVNVKYEAFSSSKNENGDKNNNEDDLLSHKGPSATLTESTIYSISAVLSIIFKTESSKMIIDSLFLTGLAQEIN